MGLSARVAYRLRIVVHVVTRAWSFSAICVTHALLWFDAKRKDVACRLNEHGRTCRVVGSPTGS